MAKVELLHSRSLTQDERLGFHHAAANHQASHDDHDDQRERCHQDKAENIQ